MKSFQDFMEDAFQSLENNQIDEAAGDASAFRERHRARQSAMVSAAKSKAAKYRDHGVRGADKKSQQRIKVSNKKLAKAAGQLGSAAIDVVKAGARRLRAMGKKKEEK
jgi:hypothetical protein